MSRYVCPMCNGPLELLGYLGNRRHSRCRNCGAITSREGVDRRSKAYRRRQAADRGRAAL
jgi:hypothetical protein